MHLVEDGEYDRHLRLVPSTVTLASEAGGVFDFGSKGNEDGAFRGAFGGGQELGLITLI